MIAFGPVPSRRLGRSLGINQIPPKVCTYSCVYCQLGRTTAMRTVPEDFFPPERVLAEVRERVLRLRERGEALDNLTFVCNGEPTLDKNLGEEIELLKTRVGERVAVITNGSLLWRKDVRQALDRAHWVSVKVDSCRESTWRRINRPDPRLELNTILEGILSFAHTYRGRFVTETMLVKGVNEGIEELGELASFLEHVGPSTAYLSVPTRPPAEEWVRPPDEAALNAAFQGFSERLTRVELLTGHEGAEFAFTGSAEEELLSMASVHPLREDSLNHWLRKAGRDWSLVAELLRQGLLVETEYNGRNFYLRSLHRTPTGDNSPALRERSEGNDL